MSDMTLRTNTRVRITGAEGYSVVGRVEEIRAVGDLPDVPDRAGVILAPREILSEIGAAQVALISYKTSPENELIFAALEIGGEWFDLRKQKLEIETVWV